MKKILFASFLSGVLLAGCKKYSDDYLDAKLPKTIAYFASFQEYTRTVVVGEGMQFKIGAAMAGVLENKQDRTVDFVIGTTLNKTSATDTRVLLPLGYYNGAQLSNKVRATIPAGEFIGYFTVVLDSINFLNDPLTMNGKYTLPVNIVGTSLDSIAKGLDSIKVSVTYMARVDGYYLYQQTIKKEVGGTIIDARTQTDNYPNESDNSAWRLLTQGPFKVKVTSAVAAFTSGLTFNMSVDANKVITYESIAGQPVVTPEATNSYDAKTRDFTLNYNYKKPGITDTTYHVSSKLIFRNRIRDKVNETRDYLSYFN